MKAMYAGYFVCTSLIQASTAGLYSLLAQVVDLIFEGRQRICVAIPDQNFEVGISTSGALGLKKLAETWRRPHQARRPRPLAGGTSRTIPINNVNFQRLCEDMVTTLRPLTSL